MKVNGLSGELKEYQQRSRRALTSARTQGKKATRRNALAIKSTGKEGDLK
jgi:hypothetical protein